MARNSVRIIDKPFRWINVSNWTNDDEWTNEMNHTHADANVAEMTYLASGGNKFWLNFSFHRSFYCGATYRNRYQFLVEPQPLGCILSRTTRATTQREYLSETAGVLFNPSQRHFRQGGIINGIINRACEAHNACRINNRLWSNIAFVLNTLVSSSPFPGRGTIGGGQIEKASFLASTYFWMVCLRMNLSAYIFLPI